MISYDHIRRMPDDELMDYFRELAKHYFNAGYDFGLNNFPYKYKCVENSEYFSEIDEYGIFK